MDRRVSFILVYVLVVVGSIACAVPPTPDPMPTSSVPSPALTATSVLTPTLTPVPVLTVTPTLTLTPTLTMTPTLTLTPTQAVTPTVVATATVTPTSAPPQPPDQALLGQIDAIIAAVNGLDAGDFEKNKQKTLLNKLEAVRNQIQSGAFQGALNKLENDILPKVGGCALSGSPDSKDWIVNCAAQDQVYPLIVELIEALRAIV